VRPEVRLKADYQVMNIHLLALQASTGGLGGLLGGALPIIFLVGVMYFILIMPQQRRQKKWQAMLGELKNGDKVVTSGGLKGTIIALRDDSLHIRVPPDNLKMEVTRASIVSVTTDDAVKTEK
jgi:preprotein translocase subunit YajC